MPASRLPYIASLDQAARWRGYGADLDAALQRWQAFRARWEQEPAATAARSAVAFAQAEAAQLAAEGVPAGDPDFWRLLAFAKHMMRG